MMQAAARAAKENSPKGKESIILGVTILTSLDDKSLREIGFKYNSAEMVLRLAKLAKKAGAGGIVSSPKEVKMLRKTLGKDMVLVTPGIRPTWAAAGDQKRVMTPKDAIKAGADFMVIGRPITAHKNPAEAADLIAGEI
jgi:orotidine-5'-phosphate decarboxylase